MTVRYGGLSVTWFGYATARIETPGGHVAYLDPGRYGVLDAYDERAGGPDHWGGDGNLVCVTHVHHYDPAAIDRIAADDATVVAYEGIDVADTDRDVTPPAELPYDVVAVEEEDRYAAEEAIVWSLPAYNRADGPHTREDGTPYHPKGFGVGFLLSIGGRTVFWPGDSDVLDGHRELEVSLFLANVGGSFCTDAAGAANLAETLDPDLVVPIHYDTFEALEADSGAFAADVASRGVPVALDERGVGQ